LAVLLPARNCAADLPGWFAAVEGFADAVVALDDGSTDATAEVLAAHPLTRVLIRNPLRATSAGWDDAANRQRLVEACAELEPNWLLQLDADERLPVDDAWALRRTLDRRALDPAAGYLLQVLRMVEGEAGCDREHFDDDHLWVGRLFAWRPGIRLPADRLHLVPLPVDIPQERRVRTTLRICHYGSSTAARRRARRDKYLEADPDRTWQQDYDRLLDEPADVRHVAARPPSLPVVPNQAWVGEREDATGHPAGEPLLTAVVISRDDEAVIERAVGAVVAQQVSAPVQVVVVTSGTDRTADFVRRRFPQVELVVLDRPALPGEARNAGLARARGRYITFPGSHIELPPGSLEARLQAHLDGWGLVTGTTRNGTHTPSGWASYFLDHSGALPARPSRRMDIAPSNASYPTEVLRAVGGFPADMRTAEDTMVNTALFRMGYGAWQNREVTMIHHSPCRTVARLLRHHYTRGRGLGQMILRGRQPGRPVLNPARVMSLGLRYVPGRLHRIHHYTWRYGESLRWRWLVVSPLCVLAVMAAWVGAWREILHPGRGRWELLFADRLRPGALLARGAARARRRPTWWR
jgi:glycosyltransferase involved in cell wall biosynthesis